MRSWLEQSSPSFARLAFGGRQAVFDFHQPITYAQGPVLDLLPGEHWAADESTVSFRQALGSLCFLLIDLMILTTEGLGHPPFRDCRDDLVRCDRGGVDQGLMCDTLGFPKPYVFERNTLGLTSV